MVVNGFEPGFDPLDVGLGLGITQGFAAGALIGILALAVGAWRDTSKSTRWREIVEESRYRPREWRWLTVWALSSALLVGAFSGAAFLLGGIVGQSQLYQSWTEDKLRRIEPILRSERFSRVESYYSSAAQVYLTGDVDDAAALQSLKEQLVSAFGDDEADTMLRDVRVAK